MRSVAIYPGSRLLMVTLCCGRFAGDGGDEAGQAGAGAVGQPQGRHRDFHRHAGDVDDAAEPAVHHAVQAAPDHVDGAVHVGVDGVEPVLLAPVAKIAGRRSAGVVDQDVRCRAGCRAVRRTAFVRRDIGDQGLHGAAAGRGDFGGRLRPALPVPGADPDIHAFAGQRQRAGLAQALAGRANDGVSCRLCPRSMYIILDSLA